MYLCTTSLISYLKTAMKAAPFSEELVIKTYTKVTAMFINCCLPLPIFTPFAVHYEKIRIHFRGLTTNSAKMHS